MNWYKVAQESKKEKQPYLIYIISDGVYGQEERLAKGVEPIYAYNAEQARSIALAKHDYLRNYINSLGNRDIKAKLDEKALQEKKYRMESLKNKEEFKAKRLEEMYNPESEKAAWWVK